VTGSLKSARHTGQSRPSAVDEGAAADEEEEDEEDEEEEEDDEDDEDDEEDEDEGARGIFAACETRIESVFVSGGPLLM